ncbi:MAG: N-6 DNA methylase [Verrucomicrobia bacterium]|nr:N-6 DNA methylase [Verrucomicrobiota bacterium]
MSAPATFETFQQELARLVDKFDRDYPQFVAANYNEATLRSEFLDDFFRALGWDVGNKAGLIHTEREVDIEVQTATSGRQTRADYVFRIARVERFTCEAKKPAEKLNDKHIYQAKRDAFARGVPFAVLTDFEDLKIFVVGARPHRDDPHVGELKALNFRQYPLAARELWDLLAYESVRGGSLDRELEKLPKRPLKLKGKQTYLLRPDRTKAIDADFLNFLDDVRQQLGSDLLKHNDRDDLLTGHRLNEAAQRIIDRLIFLRICEDRGIDTGELLSSLFGHWYRQQTEPPKIRRPGRQSYLRFGGGTDGSDAVGEEPAAYSARGRVEGTLYREIVEHVRALDQRPASHKPFFNGQLFSAHFSEDLVVGDEWLANFISDLTDEDNGYNFATIKVEILGDAYERFLGKILRPQGRGATIEEKPEVRKAGGVYYTPRYITDYIVEQTIGRLLEGKSPKEVEKLRFVDPACGSGSFLIRAYERVMEHHLRWFIANPAQQKKADCFTDLAGNVRLTTALKRRILVNNIYGVDIDAQAVEVTQLSLYLKMLEDENRDTLRQQTELFRGEPLLPALDKNIRCFNSLIASDFSLDPDELARVNAGDWDVQFPAIMKAGGFDAVVGNPPYIPIETMTADERSYYQTKFAELERKFDTSVAFILAALRLVKPTGLVGYISSLTWETGENYAKLRQTMFQKHGVVEVINLPFDIFDAAYVETCAYVLSGKPTESYRIRVLPKKDKVGTLRGTSMVTVPTALVTKPDFRLILDPAAERLFRRVSDTKTFIQLGEVTKSTQGLAANRFTRSPTKRKAGDWFPFGERCQGYRYDFILEEATFADMAETPSLTTFYEAEPKILIRRVINRQDRLDAAFVDQKMVFKKDLNPFVPLGKDFDAKSLLGILNSRLISYLYINSSAIATKDDFRQTTLAELRRLPVPRVLQQDATKKRLVALVDKMLTLTPALREADTDAKRHALENALAKTDRDIDQLVYQLYALTPEEIALVEGAGTPAAPSEAN